MLDSPSSSDPQRGHSRFAGYAPLVMARCRGLARSGGMALALAALSAATGCATVRPAEKEFLADPAMTFDSGGMARAHEEHVLQNREGSFGAGGARGGGCGCN